MTKNGGEHMRIFQNGISKKCAGTTVGHQVVGLWSMQGCSDLTDHAKWVVARIRNAVKSAGCVSVLYCIVVSSSSRPGNMRSKISKCARIN